MMRKWGGLYILGLLFAVSILLQFLGTVWTVSLDAEAHRQAFAWADVWAQFLEATTENWQSEWLQLILQAVLMGVWTGRVFAAQERAEIDTMKTAVREVLAERGSGAVR